MADLDRIKRNVQKMAMQQAPEADIDGYLASEGVTPEQIRTHKMSMGWGEVASSAVQNIPSSAARFGGNIVHAVTHPIETVKTLADVGYGGLSKAVGAVGVPMDQTAKAEREQSFDAVADFFVDRYGGVENFKRTLAEDPVGFAADLSTVLGGVGALPARVPGVVGKTGQAVQAAGRAIDPIRAAATAIKATGSNLIAPVIGAATGTGAETVRAAAEAGSRGNRAFIDNMRGNAGINDSIDMAQSALGQIRKERGAAYRSSMQGIKENMTPLDQAPIAAALSDAYGMAHFRGVPIDEVAAKTVEEMAAKVAQFRSIAKRGPADTSYRAAEGMDALKKAIGEIRQRTQPNTLARNVADSVYNTVKSEIVRQVPEYAKAMEAYAQASDRINDIQKTFSITERAAPDTTARKLQSVMRNNVNTNYGRRTRLMEELAKHEPNLPASLAGQAMSSPVPRGLQALSATGTGIGGITHMNPYALAALPFMSPRLMGEAAYGTGTAARMIESMSRKTGLSKERIVQILLGARAAGELDHAAQPAR